MRKFFVSIAFVTFIFASFTSLSAESKKLPVLVAHESQFELDGLGELSGLCLSKDEDFLWGVGDEGFLYRINFDGTFSLEWEKPSEMEGLALDPNTGNLYIALEKVSSCAFMIPYSGSGYNFGGDFKELFAIKDVAELGNKGVEGIAWYKGGLYFGAQKKATLYHYTLDGKQVSKKSLKDMNVCDIKEIADLDYDEKNDWLWIVDSKMLKIYLFKGDASARLATYDIKENATVNPEGICVDKKHDCIWICEDIHKKSILHKYKFDSLQ